MASKAALGAMSAVVQDRPASLVRIAAAEPFAVPTATQVLADAHETPVRPSNPGGTFDRAHDVPPSVEVHVVPPTATQVVRAQDTARSAGAGMLSRVQVAPASSERSMPTSPIAIHTRGEAHDTPVMDGSLLAIEAGRLAAFQVPPPSFVTNGPAGEAAMQRAVDEHVTA